MSQVLNQELFTQVFELPKANLNYNRSISLGDVTLQYTVTSRPVTAAE